MCSSSVDLDTYRRVVGLFSGGKGRRGSHGQTFDCGCRLRASALILLMSLLFFTLRADQLLAHGDVEPNPGPEDPLSRGALASKSNCSHIEDDAGRRHCRPDSNMSLTSHLNP